jgi:endonuclease/exonuclease/phosphatase family metal-dependent hydrolase
LLVGALLVALTPAPGAPAAARREFRISPPGQIALVTVNARQKRIVGRERFEALLELALALRNRPDAFDGGFEGAAQAPDVVVVQEMRPSNLEILERQLRKKYSMDYRVIGSYDATAQIIANLTTVRLDSEVREWDDVCLPRGAPDLPEEARWFQWARFVEEASGQPFVLAAVHFSNHYGRTGEQNCLARNLDALRAQVDDQDAPVVVAGDFNKRPVTTERECDPEETSEPLTWYAGLTAPADGARVYTDSVRAYRRAVRGSMEDEWTFERHRQVSLCTGALGYRRSRIDYIFVSGAAVAWAGADHPGWAGEVPGTKNGDIYKYSDHRFVAARLVLPGPARGPKPVAAQAARGRIELTWNAPEAVAGWAVYRAFLGRDYALLARLPAGTTAYSDTATEHGRRYRYALAPLGLNGVQGLESRPAYATADARGPRVIAVKPRRDATGVARALEITVWLDEPVDRAVLSEDAIRLFGGGRRVPGEVRAETARRLIFEPAVKLDRSERYRVLVTGLTDLLGNRGRDFDYRFTTGKR